ncbi:hypothetical protein VP01_1461g6 [Puccinia sorghi]|uniref:Uncharacterized protein n=1 Tax=Puccinia sorghi TaxID=27349 RepID=A0A0L6VJT8_9BASI|nr:hypothetical protein VP01_1461g6 [Puccinia sorghi]
MGILVDGHLGSWKGAGSSGSNKAKKKSWGQVNSSHKIPLVVAVEVTSFKDFQMQFILACNSHFPGAGAVITKGLKSIPPFIHRYGSIARACEIGQTKVSLTLRMENPAKLAKQAEMEDLLAAQVMCDKAVNNSVVEQSKAVDSDSEGKDSDKLDPRKWDNINIHMKKNCVPLTR